MEINQSIKRVAVIGAGISGLSIANMLKEEFEVTIFEKEEKPGGLVKCERKEGYLFHLTGGHVFNSKHQEVLDWFWKFFDRDKEFSKKPRNAVISINDSFIGYPIENHLYMLNPSITKQIINELLFIHSDNNNINVKDFESFLKLKFGNTLYQLYFQPYNKKIWNQDLKDVPLSWLEGKLPMPSTEEIFFNNIHHLKEEEMVHSSFWYAKNNGSQFIADRLAENLKIRYHQSVSEIKRDKKGWSVCGEHFDCVIFCGNIKQLPNLLNGIDLKGYTKQIEELKYHGTTSVLCKVQKNPYSWVYMPDNKHLSHRIICTGNFAASNNPDKETSAIIEFTDYISYDDILDNLQRIPFAPKYVAHHYAPFAYPIQGKDTRSMIQSLKNYLRRSNLFILGRFADWEYYNMDAAIGAAMKMSDVILSNKK